MRMLRFSAGWICVVISSLAMLVGGCIIKLGLGDLEASGGDTTSQASASASGGGGSGSGDAPPLTDAQRTRKDEVDRYVAQVVYKGATVTQSLETAEGEVVDGLDRSTLPALPYPLPALPYLPAEVSLPPGVTFGLSGVQQNPALADLVAQTAGFHRPNFQPYITGETDATSIEDYLDRYEVGGEPEGNKLYAGLISRVANRGVSGYVNQFKPEVAKKSLSIMELVVGCPADNPTEMVGVVISVDRVNLGGRNQQGVYDGLPRLHVEFANVQKGKMTYTWDEIHGHFVANTVRSAWPGQVVPVSVLGGAQVEHLLTIFQSPTGDWWIAYDMNLLGYYPASLFKMLSGGACMSAWYGEVHNPEPKRGAVETEMGSGKFAADGHPNVAYFRKPEFYDTSWFSAAPDDTIYTTSYEPSCYTRSALYHDPVSGDLIFDLGGPGGKGKETKCKWPFP